MPRILVIDDDPGVVSFLRRGLSLEGFEVQAAEEGPQALELFERFPPDLVLLDRRMTGMGGLEVLARIRALRPEVPVVILSGSDPEPGEPARLGVQAYLLKPVQFDTLVATLRSLLRG